MQGPGMDEQRQRNLDKFMEQEAVEKKGSCDLMEHLFKMRLDCSKYPQIPMQACDCRLSAVSYVQRQTLAMGPVQNQLPLHSFQYKHKNLYLLQLKPLCKCLFRYRHSIVADRCSTKGVMGSDLCLQPYHLFGIRDQISTVPHCKCRESLGS